MFAMTIEDAEQDPTVVAGTLFISGMIAHVLIDSGSTHSFASP
ncbi:hypothetical protein, partial [Escherichia coli]